MQTVGKLIGRNQYGTEPTCDELITADRLGIEIELEGFGTKEYKAVESMKYWVVKEDGSLRNGGVEFVTNGGLGGANLVKAIDEVHGRLASIEFNNSWRCSTHMHINMLDCTLEQCVRVVLAYMCVENIMFDFCNPSRRHSNFCVPLTTAQGTTRDMVCTMSERFFGRGYGSKYMALNVLPLCSSNLGTLEFRGSHALTTRDELLSLANRLLSIRAFALNFTGSIEEMLYSIEVGGWQQVLTAGVPEGYVCDYELFEKAVMSAWSAHKRYVRVELDTANNPIPEDLTVESPVGPAPSRSFSSAAYADSIRRHQEAMQAAISTTSSRTNNYFAQHSWATAAAPTHASPQQTELSHYVRQSIEARYWSEFRRTNAFIENLSNLVAELPEFAASYNSYGGSTFRRIVRLIASLHVPQFAPSHGADNIIAGLNMNIQNWIAGNRTSGISGLVHRILALQPREEWARFSRYALYGLETFSSTRQRFGKNWFNLYHSITTWNVSIKNRQALINACGDDWIGPTDPDSIQQMPIYEIWAICQIKRLDSTQYVFQRDLATYRDLACFLDYQMRNGAFQLVKHLAIDQNASHRYPVTCVSSMYVSGNIFGETWTTMVQSRDTPRNMKSHPYAMVGRDSNDDNNRTLVFKYF